MAQDELTIIVTGADGYSKALSSSASVPDDRPRAIQFSSQLASGFYTGTFNVHCPIDRDRDDLHLLDDVRIVTSSGETVYEGFVGALPRSTDDSGGTLTVSLVGYMATTQAQSFREIYVDRDMAAWGPASTARRVSLLQAPFSFGTVHDPSNTPDQSGRPTIRLGWSGSWAAGAKPISEAHYDAGPGAYVGRITATGTRGPNVLSGDANWAWLAAIGDSDLMVAPDNTGDLHAAGPVLTSLAATAGARRFAMLQLNYDSAGAAGLDGLEYSVDWSDVAVYGTSGVPLLGSTAPYGVAGSDVFRHLVETHCPLLNADGVRDTTFPIPQLAFKDRTKVYDALLKVNSYHKWNFAVWEDRTLTFQPIDLTDWDWEIRHDEIGNQIGLQGDEYTQLRNGIIVQYQNLDTGRADELHPDDHPELRDDSLANPFNQHGWAWTGEPFQVPFPTTTASALQLGRIQLLEDNQPKAAGQFTCHNRIRDRAGVWQPVAKVRAGQTIRLTSSVNLVDRPRLIHEASFSQDGRTATLTVDSTARVLDAVLDRNATALAAAGVA